MSDLCSRCRREASRGKKGGGPHKDDYLSVYSLVRKALQRLEGEGDGIHPAHGKRLEKVLDHHPEMEKDHRKARRALESILDALDDELN